MSGDLGPVYRTRYVRELGRNEVVHLPVHVYAYLNAEGEYLYIGHTINPIARHHHHRARASWIGEALDPVILSSWDTKGEGLAAEAEAIRTFRPLHNTYHSPNRRRAA